MNTYSLYASRACAHPSQFQKLYDEAPLLTIPGIGRRYIDLAFGPAETLAAGVTGDQVYLWNSSTYEPLRILEPAERDPYNDTHRMSIAYGPEGTLVGGSASGRITIWDVITGNILRTIRVSSGIRSISCSPDGTIAAVTNNSNVTLWNLFSGALIRKISLNIPDWIQSVRYNREGTILAVSFWERKGIYVWSAPSYDDAIIIDDGPSDSILFFPDGNLVVGSSDGRISIWEPLKNKLLQSFENSGYILSMAYDKSGHLITSSVVSPDSSVISIWEPYSGTLLQRFPPTMNNVITAVASNPYTGLLAAASRDINIYAPTSRPGGKRAR